MAADGLEKPRAETAVSTLLEATGGFVRAGGALLRVCDDDVTDGPAVIGTCDAAGIGGGWAGASG
jgi:hypothetical protein